MAELTQQERLQPSLLDRLTDDEPHRPVESRDRRVLSMQRLREVVLRDLEWLLNTAPLDQVQDLSDYPHVARSVLNYGVPDLAGQTLSGADLAEIERRLRQAILDFEPRILRNTLKIRVQLHEDRMSRNALTFEIEGELWAQPIPLQLFLKTELDLETGNVTVSETFG